MSVHGVVPNPYQELELYKKQTLRIKRYCYRMEVNGYKIETGANLYGARFRSYDDLTGAKLDSANLGRAEMFDSKFPLADLQGANLSFASMYRIDLTGANLQFANLAQADLRGAIMQNANLICANLTCAWLGGEHPAGINVGANLSQANLTRANLSGANLGGADLSHAKLCMANLSYSDLRYAKLAGADMKGAQLMGALCSDIDFTDAIMPNGIKWHAQHNPLGNYNQ